jgi:hypothetical protein
MKHKLEYYLLFSKFLLDIYIHIMFSLGLGSHEATFALGISIKLRPSLFSFELRLKSQPIKSKESVP